ncbi:MAG: hypothetical protein PUJ11_00270 [Eubacteriaceae bacterium]|nr:hypothetical protein [Eubacteriaceae bacterium]
MDEIKKSCLLTEIQMMGHLWEDDQLRESVKSAIMAENIEDLARIIDKLAVQVNHQKKTIQSLRDREKEHEEHNEEILSELKQISKEIAILKKPAAYRADLDTQRMIQLYEKYKSFRKVGELIGCEGKTVKRRLQSAGYDV